METLDLRLHPPLPSTQPPPSRGLLTASDLKAAELLVQLSESSGGGADDWCSSSSSSTPRSVELPRSAPPLLEAEILLENEDDEEETGGPWRRTRRYRPIADVYAATAPVGVRDLDRRRPAERRNEKKSRRAED